MVQLSAETTVRLRMFAYIFLFTVWLCYTGAVLWDVIRFSTCLVDPLNVKVCTTEGYRVSLNSKSTAGLNTDDYEWRSSQTYINSDGKYRNVGNQSRGYFAQLLFIFINFYLSSTLSLIVVWLVDHREAPNGFTRLIQWFCAFQVLMDLGFFIEGLAMSAGYYNVVAYSTMVGAARNYFVSIVGSVILTLGDESSVLFTTVMAYTFFQIARTQSAIDITAFLNVGVSISVGVGVVVVVLQAAICETPNWKYECSIVRVRGWISVLCIVVNAYYAVRVRMLTSAMKEGKRKDAIASLSSRILFYSTWVAFSRIGYIGLTITTGSLNLNFYDKDHRTVTNVLSSLTFLMWLPTGTGFAIYYLYTHPNEYKFFCTVFWDKLFCRRSGNTFLPDDVAELWDRWMISCCGSASALKYPKIDGVDHSNSNAGVESGDPEEGGTSNDNDGGLGRLPRAGASVSSSGAGASAGNPLHTTQSHGADKLSVGSRASHMSSAFLPLGNGHRSSNGDADYETSNDSSALPVPLPQPRRSIRHAGSYELAMGKQLEDVMLDACLLGGGDDGDSAIEAAHGDVLGQSIMTTTSVGSNVSARPGNALELGVRDSHGEGALPIQRSIRHSEV